MTPREIDTLHQAQAIAYSYGGDLNKLADAIAAAIREAERAAREEMREKCARVAEAYKRTLSAAAAIRTIPTDQTGGGNAG